RLHNSSPPAPRPRGRTARGLAPAPDRRHANPRLLRSAATARRRTPTSSPASTPFSPTQTLHTTSARLHSSPGGLLRSSQPPFWRYSHPKRSLLARPAHSLSVACPNQYVGLIYDILY